nr:type I restriction endonuclease [Enterobacter cloacae complex sp. ECL68]
MTKEQQIEKELIAKLKDLKYIHRDDIHDKASLEENFRKKFETLNRVNLSDAEFDRLREEIITVDVFKAAQVLREKGKFTREDGTPLEYTLVNIKDWCKNDFEVINQLRINTDNSHHRYDVILLINGLPLVQIELKTLQISPRRAMEQIVDYKTMPEMAITIVYYVLCNYLSLVTVMIHVTLLTTVKNTLVSMLMNVSCQFINTQIRIIKKLLTCTTSPMIS